MIRGVCVRCSKHAVAHAATQGRVKPQKQARSLTCVAPALSLGMARARHESYVAMAWLRIRMCPALA